MITLDPPLGVPLTAAVSILLCVATLVLHLRSVPGVGLRLSFLLAGSRILAVMLLGLVLLNPVRARVEPTQRRAPLRILVDTSRSMAERDAAGAARLSAAIRLTAGNPSLLRSLSAKYDVRFALFDDQVRAATADQVQASSARGGRTDIGAALRNSQNEAANGGHILLISDGRDNAERGPVEAARSIRMAGGMVHTLCLGTETSAPNTAVVPHRSQVFGAPGQRIEISGEVRSNRQAAQSINVDLLKEGKRVESRLVELRSGRGEFQFGVRESQPGWHRYSVAVQPTAGEAQLTDNRAPVLVTVARSKIRVLLLEGRPSWDARFLANVLREDSGIRLDAVYKLTEGKFYAVLSEGSRESGISLPRTLAEFSKYDVILVGRGYEDFFDTAATASLKEWVARRGGGLVFLRGRALEQGEGLADLEPLTWTRDEVASLQLRLTEAGRQYPGFAHGGGKGLDVVVRQMPALVSATHVQGEKAMTVVLARGSSQAASAPEMAVIAHMRYGQGTTMAIAGQGLWRWAFLTPQEREANGLVYPQFWSQTIRWLVSGSDFLPGARAGLRVERERYGPGEAVVLRGSVRDAVGSSSPFVTILRPDGARVRVAAAAAEGSMDFTATYQPKVAGDYLAFTGPEGGAGVAQFRVEPRADEDADRSANPDLMRQIAEEGNGMVIAATDIGNLTSILRSATEARSARTRPQPLWDRGWLLAAMVALLLGEWSLRRRAGLA
jgi:hypothetical protein